MGPEDRLAALPRGVRRALLRVLTSPSDVRADAIRRLYEREGDLAELLMDLEADHLLREEVVTFLELSLR